MAEATTANSSYDAEIGDLIALLKPRVMSLVVFTSVVGIVIAPVPVHPVIALASVLFIALGAGASGSLNMWWDADIDALMSRTRSRPVPSGKVSREDAFFIGTWLTGLSVVMLALTANFLAAGLLAFTIFFYVVIYTMYLKRRTPQNIVIGGAAGALPPVIGWAAATGSVSVESLLMFLLIFVWTPPHFWALALFSNDDYSRAGVPMLTVVHGSKATRRQIFAYSAALLPLSLALAFSHIGGPVTLALAILLNGAFIVAAWTVLHRRDDDSRADRWFEEKRLFRLSLYYLFAMFAGFLADFCLRWQFTGLQTWPAWY